MVSAEVQHLLMLAYGILYKLMNRQIHNENQTDYNDMYLGKQEYKILQVYKYKTNSETSVHYSGKVLQLFDISVCVVRHTIMSSRHTAALCCNNKEQHVLP